MAEATPCTVARSFAPHAFGGYESPWHQRRAEQLAAAEKAPPIAPPDAFQERLEADQFRNAQARKRMGKTRHQ